MTNHYPNEQDSANKALQRRINGLATMERISRMTGIANKQKGEFVKDIMDIEEMDSLLLSDLKLIAECFQKHLNMALRAYDDEISK
jgi:hypothetical protein